MAAPTGRAAKRMAESAGEEATTIHRLLEYNPREAAFSAAKIILCASILSSSMRLRWSTCLWLDHLLRAPLSAGYLILVGYVDQLPSVGPGSVLRDLIDSGVIEVVLRRIFRQDRQSLIVVNAHRILQGQSLAWLTIPAPATLFFWRTSRKRKFSPRKNSFARRNPARAAIAGGRVS